ncbi:conserved hypothetical protein, partial [Ricinus communis]
VEHERIIGRGQARLGDLADGRHVGCNEEGVAGAEREGPAAHRDVLGALQYQAHQRALDLITQFGSCGCADRREAGDRRRRGTVAAGVGVRMPAHGIEQ